MKWITYQPAQIERLACSRIIKRFIDQKAALLFVPTEKELRQTIASGAIPYAIPGVDLSEESEISFVDSLLNYCHLRNRVLLQLTSLVRGSKIDWTDLVAQQAGTWPLFGWLTTTDARDKHIILKDSFEIFDALFKWGQLVSEDKAMEDPKIKN